MSSQTKLLILFFALLLINLGSMVDAKKKAKRRRQRAFNETLVQSLNTTAELNEFNKTHSNYFIFFYATWCKYCKEFAPIFDDASVKARNAGWKVDFVRMNGEASDDLVMDWEIESFPTVFWVNNLESEKVEYEGVRTSNGLVKFINSALNMTTEELTSIEGLSAKKKGTYMVFVGDHAKFWNIYKMVVKLAKEDIFDGIFWTQAEAFHSKLGVPADSFDAVIINVNKNKTLERIERMNLNNRITRDELEKLFEIYTRKPWGKLDEESLVSAVEPHSETPTLFTIYSKNGSYVSELSQTLETLSHKHRRDLWVLNATHDDKFANPINEVFNITEEQLPFYLLVNDNNHNVDDVDKYVLSSGKVLSLAEIEALFTQFKEGKLKKVIFSQEVPEKAVDESGIHKVVGHTYEEKVLNNNGKDTVLFLCPATTKKCTQARERFTRVIKKLTGNNNLVFAEIDSAYNEFTHIKYFKLPAFALIPGYESQEERLKNIKVYSKNILTPKIVEWIANNTLLTTDKFQTLENEEIIFKNETKRSVKPVPKDVEEELAYEEYYTTGLRRTVFSELDKDTKDFDDDDRDIKDVLKQQKEKLEKKAQKKKRSSEVKKDL
jgi:thiol-disulfide isomerase/thioredoxin